MWVKRNHFNNRKSLKKYVYRSSCRIHIMDYIRDLALYVVVVTS